MEIDGLRVREIDVEGAGRLATRNLAPGVQVYGEKLAVMDGIEYREWDPFRSKLAGAIIKKLDAPLPASGDKVLYLGASTGTTTSHISDIVEEEGMIFGVEVSPRVAREFMDRVVAHRANVIPILEDARFPDRYVSFFGKADLIYCDIAQPDQTEIAIRNCRAHLRNGGGLFHVVKARSIDVSQDPATIFGEEVAKLKTEGLNVRHMVNLEPFDKDHALIYATSA
jgi:fibrillarin-like pre-rRNA processing protein|tara:strand:- start:1779 stop:2453 length:675 start_codon:yes stop_codon:yes gene_type:complete